MAHYAFIDENNTVVEVITGRDEYDVVDGISDWESYYSEFRGQKCVRTSYNAKVNGFRKNYAGVGYTYDLEKDAFIPPKCHDEADLDKDTYLWTCTNPSHNI